MHFELTKHVQAPLDVTFATFTNLSNAEQNIPAIKQLTVLTDGPIGVGTRFEETRVMFGKEAIEQFEVTAHQPNSIHRVMSESCGCRFDCTYQFKPSEDGTDVRFSLHTQALSFWAKLFTPLSKLMLKTMKKCIEEDLEALAAAAEAATSETSSADAQVVRS